MRIWESERQGRLRSLSEERVSWLGPHAYPRAAYMENVALRGVR